LRGRENRGIGRTEADMTLKKIWAMGLVDGGTEVWVRDPDLNVLAHGDWYQDNIQEYLHHELESFVWQDDNTIYIDLKYGEGNHGGRKSIDL